MERDFSIASFVFLSSHSGEALSRMDRRMLRVMKALQERGATVQLVATPNSRTEAAALTQGIEVAPYHLDKYNYFRTRSRMRKYLERYHPVIVQSSGYEADIIARWAAKDMHTTAVNTIAGCDWPREAGGPISRAVRRWFDRTTLDLVGAVVADCQELADRLIAAGLAPEAVVVDRPSIDIAETLTQAEPRINLRLTRAQGVPIGYGGRIEEGRGLDDLVAASAILAVRGVKAQVIIAGQGPLLKRMQSDVRSSRVEYVGWVDSVPSVLKQLAVAVFPSVAPGVPTSLLEAAALGRPIVATRVEGIDGLFEDGREIRLVPPGDPKALAAAIAELVNDPERAAAMGDRARHRVVDEYSSAASVARHLALYERLMRG